MAIRDLINEYRTAAVAGVIVIIGATLGIVAWTTVGQSGASIENAFYYDLESDEIFVGKTAQTPPIIGPSGERAGVRAYVYACGQCPPKDQLVGLNWRDLEQTPAFIAYFQRYSDRLLDIRASGRAFEELDQADQAYMVQEHGDLVRAPDDERWVPRASGHARQLLSQGPAPCPGDQPLVSCHP